MAFEPGSTDLPSGFHELIGNAYIGDSVRALIPPVRAWGMSVSLRHPTGSRDFRPPPDRPLSATCMRPTPPITGWLIASFSCGAVARRHLHRGRHGNGSVAEAVVNGWIVAEVDQEIHWLRRDEDNNLTTLARDLHSLPDIACGDLIDCPRQTSAVHPRCLWMARRVDSMKVRWHCHSRTASPDSSGRDGPGFRLSQRARAGGPSAPDATPDERSHGGQDIRAGEEVTLSIPPPGPMVAPKPQTVSVTFNMGDADQVVPAIERELSRTRSNSQWTVWPIHGRLWRGRILNSAATAHATPVHGPGGVNAQKGNQRPTGLRRFPDLLSHQRKTVLASIVGIGHFGS